MEKFELTTNVNVFGDAARKGKEQANDTDLS